MILLRLFKNNRSAGVAGVILLSLGLFVISFIRPIEYEAHSGMPLYNLIFGSIHNFPVLNRIITILILWIISFMLFRTGLRYFLLEFRSYMPAIFFLFFTMVLPSAQQISPALLGSIFYLFCFAILFGVNNHPPNTFSIFNTAVVLALGSMFYLKLIWFVPLIWISLATLRTVTWRELFYFVIVYILMGLFLFTWYWVILNDPAGFSELVRQNLSISGSFIPYHYCVYLFYSFLLILVLVSSVYLANRFQSKKTLIQNIYQVMFYMFLAGMLFFLFVDRFDVTTLVFLAIPVSYLLTSYFHRRKNHWLHELLMWILLGGVVCVQLMVSSPFGNT